MSKGIDVAWYQGDDRFRELMQCLVEPRHIWAEDIPHIVAVLNEILAWCADARAYNERFHRNSWGSVIADFRQSVKNIGTVRDTRTGPATSAIDTQLRDDIAASATDLADLQTLVRGALSTLATDEALLAGWQDLLTSCSKDTPPIESVCVRHDTFWALAELTGRAPQELSRALTNVLSGDPWALHEARLALGETPQNPSRPQPREPAAPGAPGPLSDPNERLEVAKKLLTIPPRPVNHVIWLVACCPVTGDRPERGGSDLG